MNEINIGTQGPIAVSKIVDVSDLTKSSVTNDNGEALGKIDSLMVDLETGKIAYAIISFGGFPNRTKLFAVPMELLTFSHHDKKLILNIPREIMVNAPGNDTLEQVSKTVDFSWLSGIYEYYSNKTEWDQKREEERKSEALRAQQKRVEVRKVKPNSASENIPS